MTKSVEIPAGTPLILEWNIFAKEILDILSQLSTRWTKISDITSVVVWKILGRDSSYFRKFQDGVDESIEWEIMLTSDRDIVVSIDWNWVNARLEMTNKQ